MPFDAGHRLWNADLGGGALLDAGIYPISFASSILGPPSSVTAVGALAPSGVDERADLLVSSASGATAVMSTSIVTSMPVIASIMGAAGRIDLLSPFFGPSGVTLTSGSLGSEETVTWRDESFETLHEGLGYQASVFASYVAGGEPSHRCTRTTRWSRSCPPSTKPAGNLRLPPQPDTSTPSHRTGTIMTTNDTDTIAQLVEHDRVINFERFGHAEAWALGQRIIGLGHQRSAPITAAIWLGEQRVFHIALAGTSADNDQWMERKAALVRRYDASSWLTTLRFREHGILEESARMGLDSRIHTFRGEESPFAYVAHQWVSPSSRACPMTRTTRWS